MAINPDLWRTDASGDAMVVNIWSWPLSAGLCAFVHTHAPTPPPPPRNTFATVCSDGPPTPHHAQAVPRA
jgi:hypothetical protein